MPTAVKKVLTLERLRRWGACRDDYAIVAELYPAGVPLAPAEAFVAAGMALQVRAIDVQWGMVRLLTRAQRAQFVLFTLRQRQPHLVSLLRGGGLHAEAEVVAALSFSTTRDAECAIPILDATRVAAWTTARVAIRDAVRAAAHAAANAADSAAYNAGDSAAARAAVSTTSRNAAAFPARAAALTAAWAAVHAGSSTAAGDAAWGAAIREQLEWVAAVIAPAEGG